MIKRLLMITFVSLLFGINVEAKEIEILMKDSFFDSLNAKPNEFGEETITVIEDTLIGTFTITAYCSCSSCCGKSNGITASGVKAQANHTIAADIKIFPFETEVFINGKSYIVEDVGGGVNGNHIDMYFNSHSEALAFGRKIEKVYVQQEVTTVLKQVEFREYILITGDLMKRKIAESFYDKDTSNVVWKNKKGEILATREKNADGGFKNRVEKDIYDEWLRGR